VCILVAICATSVSAGEVVRDEKRKIGFRLPDGFLLVPAEARQSEFPHTYARDFEQPEQSIVLRLRGCGVLSTGEDFRADDITELRQKNPDTERFVEQWNGKPIDGVKTVIAEDDGVRRVYYWTVLPVQPEAIIVVVSGPASHDANVREQLKAVLSTFEATPSSPPSDGNQRPRRGLVVKVWHLLLAGLVFVGVSLLGWRILWRRKRLPLVTKAEDAT
jgi:hypothetical protein